MSTATLRQFIVSNTKSINFTKVVDAATQCMFRNLGGHCSRQSILKTCMEMQSLRHSERNRMLLCHERAHMDG